MLMSLKRLLKRRQRKINQGLYNPLINKEIPARFRRGD